MSKVKNILMKLFPGEDVLGMIAGKRYMLLVLKRSQGGWMRQEDSFIR